jgi:hypothetical protein
LAAHRSRRITARDALAILRRPAPTSRPWLGASTWSIARAALVEAGGRDTGGGRAQWLRIRAGRQGRHFTFELILWALRWYLAFPVSSRDLASMVSDRRVRLTETLRQRLSSLGIIRPSKYRDTDVDYPLLSF